MDPVPHVSSAAPAPAAPSVRYAGFWLRWVALLIDSFVLCIPVGFLYFAGGVALGISGGGPDTNPVAVLFFLFLICLSIIATWLYFALMEASPAQGTLGKRALGLKVTDEAGRRIGFGRATGRYAAKFLSGILFNIGYIMAAFTERKQGLHDMIAKTLVVRRAA